MIKNTILPIIIIGSILIAPVVAQDKPRFGTIDSLLRGMTDDLAKGASAPSPVSPVIESKGEVSTNTTLAPMPLGNHPSPSAVHRDSPLSQSSASSVAPPAMFDKDALVTNSHLNIRFTEMPPNATFTFTRDVFIPAYKSGVILRDGLPVLNIEPGVELVDIFRDAVLDSRHCAILSDKSYVMARGKNQDREGTWLSVSNIDIFSLKAEDGAGKNLARITFEPKSGRGVDSLVSFSLVCVMGEQYNTNFHGYRLQDMTDSLNGLFLINLPRFIEL